MKTRKDMVHENYMHSVPHRVNTSHLINICKDALNLLEDAYGGKYIEATHSSPTPSSGIPLEIDGFNYGTGSFWMCYEYEDANYPLLFVDLPHLDNRDIVCLLQLFDELYGNTNQETTAWALECQLLTRMLVTEKQLLVNPKYLDVSDLENMRQIWRVLPAEDRPVYMVAARILEQERIQRMYTISTRES